MKKTKNINNSKQINVNMRSRIIEFWDLLIIIGALFILVWALLKSFGLIHSPIWVEMIPYFGGAISLIGAAYKLGKIKRGIEETEHKVNKILRLEERFNKLEYEHGLAMCGKLKIHN